MLLEVRGSMLEVTLQRRASNFQHPTSNSKYPFMKYINHIPAWLRSKYTIALSAFLAIILFFDKNDFFTQQARNAELKELLMSKKYYQGEIASEQRELERLKNNPATLEKYAREKYLMKKDKEDLFIIPENSPEQGK
jgi:cell division protein DivIC